jgi:N-acyl-D-amino-acid deacylase
LGEAGIESIQERGRLQEGLIADITIFDPIAVTDNAEYTLGMNGLPSTGIPYVIVSGDVIVDNSVVQHIYPGQPIRYEPSQKSHYREIIAN